jgi:hypothetical protein
MRKIIVLLIAFFISNILFAQKAVKYFDTDYPDMLPKKYATNFISIKDRFQESLTLSIDGNEQLFTLTSPANWLQKCILNIKASYNGKVAIDTLKFANKFIMFAEPMISFNNRRLFFLANFRCWYSNRSTSGDWASPVTLDSVNPGVEYWYTRLLNDELSDTVFCNITKNRSMFKSNKFLAFKNAILPGCDPYISRNGDYMIFSSLKEDGYGQGDLCVCFKVRNGNWSKAYNLGPEINTEYFEYGPLISPDEKYLFFSRREKWENAAFSDIYWVSIKVIDKYRKAFLVSGVYCNKPKNLSSLE